ncbi:unnamed protein product [Urochloa humidicola]
MEVSTAQPSSGSPSAAYPRWVMFERNNRGYGYDCDSSYFTGDVNTVATADTTTGHRIQASLHLADPPASSRVLLQVQSHPGGAKTRDETDTTVVAAHGDSVLVQATIVIENPSGNRLETTTDLFVYSAGDAAAVPPRPPSLSLLPPYYIADKNYYSDRPKSRGLSSVHTGIVRRGKDEIVVAELTMVADAPELRAAELFLFRSGKWIVIKSPVIKNGDPEFGEIRAHSFTEAIIPVGDRMLCWVNLDRGLLLCDVFEDSPVLEYVKLPVDPTRRWPPSATRNVCATAGGGALKLVDVFPRCCCGDEGTTDCRRSHGACVINTWTLRMSDMVWVKDGKIDAAELWASGTYKGLPRLTLGDPLVSVDESHVVRFVMIEDLHTCLEEKQLWKVMVDMRSKTIQSFLSQPGVPEQEYCDTVIPSNVSCYLNSCPTSSSHGMLNSKGQSKMEIERSPVHVRDEDDEPMAPQIIHGESMTAGNSKNFSALHFGDIPFEEKYRKNVGKFTSAGLLSKIIFQGVTLLKAKEKKNGGKYISIGSMEVEIVQDLPT